MAATLEIVGGRWTLLVLREAFYGVARFEDFQRHLGVATNVLSARLATLVAHDLLARTPYREPGRRTRHQYALTRSGRELLPTVVALMQWGDEHLAGADGPPVTLSHRGCSHPVRAEIVCAGGHRTLSTGDIMATPTVPTAASA